MIKKFKLGVVIKNTKIVNHRSLIKVFLNPILRFFGVCIATSYIDGILGYPLFMKCDTLRKIPSFNYGINYDYIIKKRIFL